MAAIQEQRTPLNLNLHTWWNGGSKLHMCNLDSKIAIILDNEVTQSHSYTATAIIKHYSWRASPISNGKSWQNKTMIYNNFSWSTKAQWVMATDRLHQGSTTTKKPINLASSPIYFQKCVRLSDKESAAKLLYFF